MWSLFSKDPLKDFGCEVLPQFIEEPGELNFWKIQKGKQKPTGNDVTIFSVDSKTGASDTLLEFARTATKKLKTLRHPAILQFVDSVESDKVVYLATEPCIPLLAYLRHLQEDNISTKDQRDVSIAWGLFQILKGIEFLVNDANISHNNINASSIFVTNSGEWKLGGVEYIAPAKDGASCPAKILPALERYNPPEVNDARKSKMAKKWSTDMWGFGCLLWEVFNRQLDHSSSLKNFNLIPKALHSTYIELVSANPASRPNPSDVILKNRLAGGFFDDERVKNLLSLSDLQIMDPAEKSRVFKNITDHLGSYPPEVCKKKILPELLHAFEFGNAGASVLPPLLKIGTLLSEEEYQQKMVQCVIKLFSSSDRETRAKLLQEIHQFAPHLSSQTINDHVFVNIVNGFMDSNAYLRELTIKATLALSSKLNYKNLDEEVLKHFARLQSRDPEGGIRANTTVCLGKIAPYLHPDTRQKVLISAFTRSLKDPFPPARTAGILALAATQGYFLLEDIATKILPSLCASTMDPEKEVRDHVFKVLKAYLTKLENVSEDPSLKQTYEAKVDSKTVDSASGGSTWSGWALNVFTSKFQKGQATSGQPTGSIDEEKQPSGSSHVSSVKQTSPDRVPSLSQDQGPGSVTSSLARVSLGDTKTTSKNDGAGWGDLDDWENGSDGTEEEIVIDEEKGESGGGWDSEEWASAHQETPSKSKPRERSLEADNNVSNTFTAFSSVPVDPFFDSFGKASGNRTRVERGSSRVTGSEGATVAADERRKPRSGALKLGARKITGHDD